MLDKEVTSLQMDVEWTLPERTASLSRYEPCVLWISTSVARQSSWMVTAAARRPNPTRQAAGPPCAGLGGFAPPRHVRVLCTVRVYDVDEGSEEATLHIPVECPGADEDAINLVTASTSAHRGSIEQCMCGGGDGVAQGEQGLQAALCVKAEEANDQEAYEHGNTLRSTD